MASAFLAFYFLGMDTPHLSEFPHENLTQYRLRARRSAQPRAQPPKFKIVPSRFLKEDVNDLTWNGLAAEDRRAGPCVRLVRLALADPHHRRQGALDRLIIHTP